MSSIIKSGICTITLASLFFFGCREKAATSVQCGADEIATNAGCVPVGMDGGTPFLPTPMLPMTVDNWYVPSGYMGDGEDPEARYLSAPQACSSRAHSEAVGECHRFEYDAGPAGQAGVFWQYPANNWGENGEEGLPIPAGAQSIRFFAWSDTAGTVVKFMVGLSEEIDGFTAEITNIELSTEPTEYTIDIRNAEYSTVIGAFGWYAEATDAQLTIHVDDIHWSEEPPLDDYVAPELVLPLSVEAWFSPSGYMGDGEDPEARYLSSPSTCSESGAAMLSTCTEFSYTAGPVGGAGVFWQYPADNWGLTGDACVDDTIVCDTEGLAVPAGAQSIQFTAWTNQESYAVEFLAGISSEVDGFSVKQTVTLTQEPTRYSLDLNEVEYGLVIGGFGWYATAADETLVVSIGDITWTTEPHLGDNEPQKIPVPSHPDHPLTLPYPLLAAFGPSGVMPASASSMVDIEGCDMALEATHPDCVAFTTVPGASPWAGVWYHTMDDGWMGPAAALPDGSVGLEFYAWANQPGVFRKFGVGDGNAGDSIATTLSGINGINAQGEFELPLEPTLYQIPFESTPAELIGGFFWAGPVNASVDMPSVVYVAEAKFVDTLTPMDPPDDPNQNDDDPGNLIANGSFENESNAFNSWLKFPNSFANGSAVRTGDTFFGTDETFTALDGAQGYKVWPQSNGAASEVSLYQERPHTEQVSYRMTISVFHSRHEPFLGETEAKAFIKFFSSNYGQSDLFYSETTLNVDTPQDVWTELSVCVVGPVPTERPKVQAGLQLNQAQANDPGTVYMDLARLEIVESCP